MSETNEPEQDDTPLLEIPIEGVPGGVIRHTPGAADTAQELADAVSRLFKSFEDPEEQAKRDAPV